MSKANSRTGKATIWLCSLEKYLFSKNNAAFKPSGQLLQLPFWAALACAVAAAIAYFATEYEKEALLWMGGYAMVIVCGVNMLFHLGHLWAMPSSFRQIGYFIFALFFSALCFALVFSITLLLIALFVICLLLFIFGALFGGARSSSRSLSSGGSSRSSSSSGPIVGESTFSNGYDSGGGGDDGYSEPRKRGIQLSNGDTVERDITGDYRSTDPLNPRMYKHVLGSDDYEER